MACQPQTGRYPCDGSDGESRHDQPDGGAAPFERHQIPNHREDDRGSHPAESTGQNPSDQKERIRWGKTAGEGGQRETGEDPHQRPLPVEAVEHEGRQQSGQSCTESIGGYEGAELSGRNGEGPHELRAQRHHDHEIQRVGELHCSEQQQNPTLVAAVRDFVVHGGGDHLVSSVG